MKRKGPQNPLTFACTPIAMELGDGAIAWVPIDTLLAPKAFDGGGGGEKEEEEGRRERGA